MIEFNYLCYTAVEESHFTKYLYALGNYQDFVAELLKVQWAQIFESLSVDEMWLQFQDILLRWSVNIFQPQIHAVLKWPVGCHQLLCIKLD